MTNDRDEAKKNIETIEFVLTNKKYIVFLGRSANIYSTYVGLFLVFGIPRFDQSPNFRADFLLGQSRIKKEEV